MMKLIRLTWCLSCTAALLATPVLQAAQPSLNVEVLDTLIFEEPQVDGLKIVELSGLTYDKQSKQLFAVSDKGRLFRFSIDVTGDKIVSLQPESGHKLVDARERSMRKQHEFNAEGIELDKDGTLVIVSEVGPRISRFSLAGEWLEDLETPVELSDPAAQRSKKDGLESLARHPTLGWLTAPEEPLAAMQRTTHTLYTTGNDNISYDTSDIGSTNIKAMTALSDGRLMILERKVAADDSLEVWLRTLDPARCSQGKLCATQVAQVAVPGIDDADYEGIADLTGGLFLIVSDDKINKVYRSVFALLKVTAAKAQSATQLPDSE